MVPKIDITIPDKLCLSCEGCCRFIKKSSPWAPLFLPHEITEKIRPYLRKSGRVKLKYSGNIYICPFFNFEHQKCSIYTKRPLDCRLYPFTITFNKTLKNIVLGIDTKCPFALDEKNNDLIRKHSERLLYILEQQRTASLISANKHFIGKFDSDINILGTLDSLTKIIVNNPKKNGFRQISLRDKNIFDLHFKRLNMPHSYNSFVNLYIWKKINNVWWKKTGDNIETLMETPSSFLPLESVRRLPDYIYLSKDIAELKGNGFKHKRANYNHFIKNYEFHYMPFHHNMISECLNLFLKWGKNKKTSNPCELQMIHDSLLAHDIALKNYKALGLVGRVIKIKDKIQAYTFGFELAIDTFCILFEIYNLTFKGISEFIFREFCKEFIRYKYINTMDDSGLEKLKSTKTSYRPICPNRYH